MDCCICLEIVDKSNFLQITEVIDKINVQELLKLCITNAEFQKRLNSSSVLCGMCKNILEKLFEIRKHLLSRYKYTKTGIKCEETLVAKEEEADDDDDLSEIDLDGNWSNDDSDLEPCFSDSLLLDEPNDEKPKSDKLIKTEFGEIQEIAECDAEMLKPKPQQALKPKINSEDSDDSDIDFDAEWSETSDDDLDTSYSKVSKSISRKSRNISYKKRQTTPKYVLNNADDNKPLSVLKNKLINMKKRRFCHICQIECPSTSVLKMHIERNHIKAENKQQKETHIKEKPLIIKKNPTFKCEKCGFGFFTQDRLDKHAIIHTPHTCGICGKTLTSKRGLLRHIDVVHCDENNHLCALCGNRYHSLHSLKKHMLTHKNEDISSDTRKYECPECGNRFKCGSYLKCHMMVHEKKKFMNASLETSAVKKAFDEVLNK